MVSKTIREIIIRPLKDRISKIRKEMKKAKGRETKKMLNEELDYCEEMMGKYKGKTKKTGKANTKKAVKKTAKAKTKSRATKATKKRNTKSPVKKKKTPKKPVKKRRK